MSRAAEFKQNHPHAFFLDANDPRAMSLYLREAGWLGTHEDLLNVEPAGEGNMNYTLRIRTSTRSFILKQSRPWVEKYPDITAPRDRALIEARFYRLAGTVPVLAARMPKLLGTDDTARLLCLEDLGPARDFTSLYAGARLTTAELASLIEWLSVLHASFRYYNDKPSLANREMRALNHMHIFVLPLASEPSSEFKREVTRLGEEYLKQGDCLLHGDFFPGSWLQSLEGIRVIDPEFCFFGPPEFDLGVMLAHLTFAGYDMPELSRLLSIYGAGIQERMVIQFAGVEIMRRLIGVARLPLTLDAQATARLLARSREMVLASS